jgi:hypothetical protein
MGGGDRVKALGIVLIVVTGLLTFHPPHFLLEAGRHPGNTREPPRVRWRLRTLRG